MIRRRNALIAASTSLLAAGVPAFAQPMRNGTRLLVGFPPGGTADVLARVLAQRLAKDGPTIVENKPGAGGRLAVTEMKNAPPDGRSILVSADPILVIYPHVFKNIAYNTLTDVTPLSTIASEPLGLVVGPMVPASVKTLADFVAWCKAHPKDASYATAAAGTSMHFLGSMLARAERMEFQHIPHRGGAAAVQDVMGGQIASTMTFMSQIIPLLSTGKLRVLAVSTSSRYKRLPEVQTFAEAGYRDMVALVYYGTYLRSGTPPAIVQQLHASVSAAGRSPEMLETLNKLALDELNLPQDRFAAFVRTDLERWGPIVKATGYSVDD